MKRTLYFLQGKLYSRSRRRRTVWHLHLFHFFFFLQSNSVLFSIRALLPREIRLSALKLKMPRERGSVSHCGRVHCELTHTHAATSWRCTDCVARRISNANAAAAAYLHVLACTLLANVQHFHNQRWPVLGSSASKYDNSVRWSCWGSCMWEKGQRVKTDITDFPPSIHPSIIPLLIWFPSMPFSAIITDDITAACGAVLHLEVKTVLSCIKNKFLCPDPLVRGSISQVRGSI